MLLFDRIAKVLITSATEQLEIEHLRFSFNIKKDESSDQNSLELMIYNMNKTLRSKFEEKDLKVELLAGYGGVAELIFKGDLIFAIDKKQGPDILTKVQAKDGGVAMRQTMWSESFVAGTTVQQIVDKLSLSFGVAIKEISSEIQGSFANGFSTTGPVKSLLDRLGSSFNFDWSIQDDELQVTKINAVLDDLLIVLNKDTGMIGIPEKLTADGDKLEEDPTIIPNGVSVTSLLLPSARPGRKLALESNTINGNFKVVGVGHVGDTRGPKWHTIIKADLI